MSIKKQLVTQEVDVRHCDFCEDVIPNQSYSRCSECGGDVCPKHYDTSLVGSNYNGEDSWLLCPNCKEKVKIVHNVEENYYFPVYAQTGKALELRFW